MTAPGCVRHSGRGDLVIGDIWGNKRLRESLAGVAAMCENAGVRCRISDNIEGELWTKMIINCAYNAISALGRAQYGVLARQLETREVMRQVTEEALAVARAGGVRLPEIDLPEAVWKIADAMSEATSSTAQDIARGNRTEIDSLNGYLVRRGAELGVPTPVNQTLHALVKLLESGATAAR
jgi:2-dehydropantoate 2-reductase